MTGVTKMDKTLLGISKAQLNDFKAYRTAGNITADKIFRILRNKSSQRDKRTSFEIDRVKIAGSIGKRSSLGSSYKPDFDVVIFVNNVHPPFGDLLLDFEEILDRNYQNTEIYIFEKRTECSLQFKLRVTEYDSEFRGTYIKFDLLPAVNLLSPCHLKLPQHIKERIQTEKALKVIYGLDDPDEDCYLYSSSLCEMTVSFVKDQSEFTHDLIRLAKLWDKKVPWRKYFCGRSMMIELVAIDAALEEENDADDEGRSESITRAFKVFLQKFVNFNRNMDVYFPYQTSTNQWRAYGMYNEEIEYRPVILDPVNPNPYNNVADNLTSRAKSAYGKRARDTLRDLRRRSWWRIEEYFD